MASALNFEDMAQDWGSAEAGAEQEWVLTAIDRLEQLRSIL